LNIGILGLGVMGRSLALNFERNRYSVAGYDIHLNFDPSFLENKNIAIFDSPESLVAAFDRPRCILLMVPAGKPVDKAISSIKSYLDKNDTIIDGGNSFFPGYRTPHQKPEERWNPVYRDGRVRWRE